MRTPANRALLCAALLLSTSGCAVETTDPMVDTPVNLEPATMEEAEASIGQLNAALERNPKSAETWQQATQLRDRLDSLNGMVARVQIAEGHVVTFYASKDGAVGVSERAPMAAKRIVTDELALQTPVEIYRRLARTDDVPEALLRAGEAIAPSSAEAQAREPGQVGALPAAPERTIQGQGGDSRIGVSRAALTAADAQWYNDNICFRRPPNDGVMCLPGWANGGSWSWNARHSYLDLAHYGSTMLRVRFSYNGGTIALDTQFPGEWERWTWHSASRNVTVGTLCGIFACAVERRYDIGLHRYDIEDAAGDGFHWSSAGRWVVPN